MHCSCRCSQGIFLQGRVQDPLRLQGNDANSPCSSKPHTATGSRAPQGLLVRRKLARPQSRP